ncbi:MAG: TaqI-like C-terminal specificity domain-containing protein, partial [Verrucomicrobiota bacterium]
PDEAKPDGQGELNQQTSWASLKRIQELHSNFFDEDSRAEKDKLRRELDGLEWNFMEATLRESGRAAALAELKRASATHRKPFFLWRLHFGEVFQKRGGFDVVIANPPYVRQEEIIEFKPAFKRAFECFAGTADLLVYFYERGVKLLREGGAVTLITSNKFYRAGYGEKLRGFLARELTLHQLIDFGDAPVFDAIAYASILAGVRTAPAKEASALAYTWEKEATFDRIAQIISERGQQIRQDELKSDGWRLESPATLRLMEKFRKAGKPLGEYVNGRFYRGIVTGLNEAFVVDTATKNQLIAEDASSAEVFKPYIRGRDMERWTLAKPGFWLIFIPWHFPLHEDATIQGPSRHAERELQRQYPAIYRHLDGFKKQLLARKKDETEIRYEWYALQRWAADYWRDFEIPKIVYPDIYEHQSFAWDADAMYLANTCYFIPTNEKWLCGLLNSIAVEWFYRMVSNQVRGGYLRAFNPYIETIPIPAVPSEKQMPVERLVNRILAAKAQDADADVSTLEQEIDKLVYALYALTPEEIKLVEDAQPIKKQPTIAERALPKGKRITLGGVKYAIQLVQALLTESADGLTWPRLVDAFTLAAQPSLMAQEAASADAAKILAWSKRWNEILPPGALITAIEQLGADNLAVTKSGNTWHISLKTARPKTSAEDVNYDAWLALRTLGPAPEIQLAAPVFATPNFAVWTQTIEALAA